MDISDLGVVSCARASSLSSWGEAEEEGEERTIFTSGGTYYLALNTTYLLWWSLLLGGLLLGALFLSSGGGASAGAGAGYGGYQQLQQRGDTLAQHQPLARNRRESADWGETRRSVSFHSFAILSWTELCSVFFILSYIETVRFPFPVSPTSY